jgi:predicted nucleic acid-binding protein
VIFVDTNVLMYAVGRRHPLRSEARVFFETALTDASVRLCTSAEVLQELMHAYVPVQRITTLDAALQLAEACIPETWSVEPEDVRLARLLIDSFPELGARDVIHLASCRRRGVREIKSFDRALTAAFQRAISQK